MKSASGEHVGPGQSAPRRLAGRALGVLARLLGVFVVLGLLLKFAGEAVSDRFWWSQWLEWTPNVLVFAGTAAVLIPATLLCRAARRVARAGPAPGTAWVLGAGWGLLLAHGAYTVAVDAPFYRARPPGPGANEASTRVVFWNAGASERAGWDDLVSGVDPDLVVLVGLSNREPVQAILGRMPEGGQRLAYDRFTVLSALPMKRFGFTHLNIAPGAGYDPRLPEGYKSRHDPGAAMYLETAATRAGAGSIVTWIIDLPSDISLGRDLVARESRAAIDAFDGQRMERGESGHWSIEPGTGHAGPKGFPTPDLIVGDFNIPRGAASLSHLRRGYPDAFEQAATGYMASFPRRVPLWHLDQAFIGPRFRAWRYRLLDAGSSEHLMQVVDLAPR